MSFPPKYLARIIAVVSLSSLLAACGNDGNSNGSSSVAGAANSSASSSLIKVNQLGFLPESSKLAVVPDVPATSFKLLKAGTAIEVFSGTLSAAKVWDASRESVKVADFSSVKTPGDYQLHVDGLANSHVFSIAPDVYNALNAASIKAFYFNRSGVELLPEFAGKFARPLGHADTQVLIHPSAASDARPSGTVVSSPKGWYDAGDYNKYIVNSGISTYTLLAAYEHFPEIFNNQNLTIPESGNALPDLLDETLWNLEWMLTMQDPNDGGVYHKLTNENFDGTIMPHEALRERYLVQKTTAATLDFAAVMATASRVFAPYETQLPGLSAKMRKAAESAWEWANIHPAIVYKQPSDVRTGEYGDKTLSDEFAWAAAELYITTRVDGYYTALKPVDVFNSVPSWGNVNGLAWVSLAHHRAQLTNVADQTLIASRIKTLADNLLSTWYASPYKVSMEKHDFVWGSNSGALNQAMMLVQAYRLNGKRDYLDAAQAQLDYVLGRNATDTSFVTGFGEKSTLHPHHRPSEADGIPEPIPGFIAGGPQPGQQDKADCKAVYPSSVAAKSYLDNYCSYASNEIAINWNAPLVYVSAAIAALTPK
ncbi:MAG: cellulase [Cellvibrio sp. 79]|nr:MAG: cellulase [Cellvibrio sp. 79]